jgi:uncharacterized membrane protein YfcA
MDFVFLILLFLIAFLYSSVGHGGGSGYLALMALCGILPEFMKPTALTLNVFVAGIAFLSYYKAGFFRLKLVLPFVISSVPMAFAGALIRINPTSYKIILGIFLLIAISRILIVPKENMGRTSNPPVWLALIIGAVLGFLSGMIGIGGGIILSPLLLLLHWATIKETAAASAFFILLNSISGLTALKISGFHFQNQMIAWVIAGILGGVLGSYSGSFRIKSVYLRYPLAVVLLIASLKLFFV